MQNAIFILASRLIIAGVFLLVVALVPVYRLFKRFPSGRIRNKWYVLTALIVFCIAGYLKYAVTNWNSYHTFADLVVPAVFFFVACFVLLVNTLSLQTAFDVRRIIIMEQENITDPLTGLYNRRYLERRLKEEVARAYRYDFPLSALLLDIDHFKKVNDTYGHLVGDQVLKNLGKLIIDTARDTDITVRYGGEEILVITPNTKVSVASHLAERLRKTVELSRLTTVGKNNEQAIRITVSIGVSGLGADGGQALIKNADEAMYRAKQEGRNRVVSINMVSPESHSKTSVEVGPV